MEPYLQSRLLAERVPIKLQGSHDDLVNNKRHHFQPT